MEGSGGGADGVESTLASDYAADRGAVEHSKVSMSTVSGSS